MAKSKKLDAEVHATNTDSNGHAASTPSGRLETGASFSASGDLDPVLADLVEAFSRRSLAGEKVNIDELCAEHPALADSLRKLLPALERLAQAGKAIDDAASTPSAAKSDGLGERDFGDFRIIREIGRGGMGIVYEARQTAIDRRVALKVLPLAAAMDPRAIQRFQLEAQVAGLLQHPHIVPIHAVGLVGDLPFYAMQYIEGGSLADLIAELRRLADRGAIHGANQTASTGHSDLALSLLTGQFPARTPGAEPDEHGETPKPAADKPGPSAPRSIRGRSYVRTVVRLGIQAAQALGYAHEQGIVHRDIKPANLLLDRRGDLWVADFGMADVQGDAGLTLTGDLPGTLRYMSPEQALGKRALVDRRTDIYSLGATLYELLSLQPAIAGTDRQEIFHRIAEVEPEPLNRLNPMVPVDLATIVSKALSKEPTSRYETSRQLADDLTRFLDGRPIMARRIGPFARSWRWCRRKPVLAGLIASLVIAIVVGFAGITWNWREAVRQRGLARVAEQKALDQAAVARRAEEEARSESEKAEAINHFLIHDLLAQAEPGNNPNAMKVTLLEVLDRAAAGVGQSFADRPDVEASIRMAIARTYHGLGQYGAAETHFRAAYERIKDHTCVTRREAMTGLGHALYHRSRFDEAETLLKQVYEEGLRDLGRGHDVTLTALEYLAMLPVNRRRDNAEALLRQLVSETGKAKGEKHQATMHAKRNLGILLESRQKYDEAGAIFREVLDFDVKTFGPENLTTLGSLFNLGFNLNDLGRRDEAEKLIQQCADGRLKILGPEHPETLYAVSMLAWLRGSRGLRDEAVKTLRECLETQRRVAGPNDSRTKETEARLDALLKGKAKPEFAKSSPPAGSGGP